MSGPIFIGPFWLIHTPWSSPIIYSPQFRNILYNDAMMNALETWWWTVSRCGSERRLSSNWRYCQQSRITTIMILGNLVEIQIGYLQNSSLDCHHLCITVVTKSHHWASLSSDSSHTYCRISSTLTFVFIILPPTLTPIDHSLPGLHFASPLRTHCSPCVCP